MRIEYTLLFFPIVLAIILGIVIYFISYMLILKNSDVEKMTIYECGFEAFEDTRSVFEVKFYLIAILFLLFDIEIVFLFPWILVVYNIGIIGYLSMLFFIGLLALVYIYEWLLGSLD